MSTATIPRKPIPGPENAVSLNKQQLSEERVPETDPLILSPNDTSHIPTSAHNIRIGEDSEDIVTDVPHMIDRPDLDEELDNLQIESSTVGDDLEPDYHHVDDPVEDFTGSGTTVARWKQVLGTAVSEAKHFAGGLISHPHESTKHYTILRHSHGIVYYHGLDTNVVITIFSDQPLPPDRSLWLQKRGFSGKTGQRIGATLGTRSAWVNVTPATTVSPTSQSDLILPNDERAWQRDIARFLRHAKDSKSRTLPSHVARETNIVRIPHIADDGYFRIVLCSPSRNQLISPISPVFPVSVTKTTSSTSSSTSRPRGQVLCASPAFRYASTSDSPARLRGASASTLPVELAVKVAGWAAKSTGQNYVSNALAPVTAPIQPYELGGLTELVAKDAAGDIMARAVVPSKGSDNLHLIVPGTDTVVEMPVGVVGTDDGPQSPYPLRFTARVVEHTTVPSGEDMALSNTSDDMTLRLSGVYIGFAAVQKRSGKSSTGPLSDEAYEWHQAVISVLPCKTGEVQVVEEKLASITMLHDFNGTKLQGVRINLLVMAFLRPANITSPSANDTIQSVTDVEVTKASLARPGWSAGTVLERTTSASSQRSILQRVSDVKTASQKQINRVPMHKLGVRTNGLAGKDQLIGNGGICILR